LPNAILPRTRQRRRQQLGKAHPAFPQKILFERKGEICLMKKIRLYRKGGKSACIKPVLSFSLFSISGKYHPVFVKKATAPRRLNVSW